VVVGMVGLHLVGSGSPRPSKSCKDPADFEHPHYLPPQDSLKRRTSIAFEIL
jgi:hypothetical protein